MGMSQHQIARITKATPHIAGFVVVIVDIKSFHRLTAARRYSFFDGTTRCRKSVCDMRVVESRTDSEVVPDRMNL
jgi:hypothetical protein